MMDIQFTDFSKCSIEEELLIVKLCQSVEDNSIEKAGAKLTSKLDPATWFVHIRRTHINIHRRAQNGKLYRNPVVTLIEINDPPSVVTKIILAHDMFYGPTLIG